MDYKYIEQLLERYWRCETSVEEEDILRAFFSQESLPDNLAVYRSLFAYEKEAKAHCPLDASFDAKVLAAIGDNPASVRDRHHVNAVTISLRDRMMPLLKAVAMVAVVVSLGYAAQFPFIHGDEQADDINYSSYTDSYSDPSVAGDKVEDALQLISEGIGQSVTISIDTMASAPVDGARDTILPE